MIFKKFLKLSSKPSTFRLFSEDAHKKRPGSLNNTDNKIYNIHSNNIQIGHATGEGTLHYSKRNPKVHPDNFRETTTGLTLGSLGYGTYLGDPSTDHDTLYYNAIINGVQSGGVNVLDTAINYRYMKSERVVGAAVKELINIGYSREELFLCSKGGYITEDGDRDGWTKKNMDQLVNSGGLPPKEIVADTHCMHPVFLQNQLELSLKNMQLGTLDLYYIHNSAES